MATGSGTGTPVSDDNLVIIRDRLRILLRDTHPTVSRRRYTSTELDTFIYQAMDDINSTPPLLVVFDIDDYADSVLAMKGLLVKGSQIFALISQGILEISKEFNYSDNGLSISFQRSGKFLSVYSFLMQNYETQKLAVKRQYFMDHSQPGAILGPQDISTMRLRTFSSRTSRIR